MTNVLAMNLKDMKVMGDDGTELGVLQNITCDLETGKLGDLVIEPSEKGRQIYDTDTKGNIRVPTRRLSAVKDYIVIRR